MNKEAEKKLPKIIPLLYSCRTGFYDLIEGTKEYDDYMKVQKSKNNKVK